MDALATNQLPKDSNQDIPRILYKGSSSITTSTTAGSWKTGTVTIGLTQFDSLGNNNIDVYILDNQTNFVYNSPLVSITSVGGFSINANHYIAASSGKLSLTVNIKKYSGSTTDTYTIYYVVYSTKISDSITL